MTVFVNVPRHACNSLHTQKCDESPCGTQSMCGSSCNCSSCSPPNTYPALNCNSNAVAVPRPQNIHPCQSGCKPKANDCSQSESSCSSGCNSCGSKSACGCHASHNPNRGQHRSYIGIPFPIGSALVGENAYYNVSVPNGCNSTPSCSGGTHTTTVKADDECDLCPDPANHFRNY